MRFTFLKQKYGELVLGEVLGLDKPGPGFTQKAFSLKMIDRSFMEKVFGLTPNHADIAANQPETEIYVVRAVEFTPFEELWPDFTAERDDWSVYSQGSPEERLPLDTLTNEDRFLVSQAWEKKVIHDAGLKWVEPKSKKGSAPEQEQSPAPPSSPPPDDDE